MKKKLCFLLISIATTAFIFTGCTKPAEVPDANQTVGTVYTSEDGLPPLNTELKALYQGAENIYRNISLGIMQTDPSKQFEKDTYVYMKANEAEFNTYEEFKAYLSQYFTADFISNDILGPDNIRFTQDEKGDLYVLDAARGANIFYAGHVFHPVEEGESEMKLTATAYYSNQNEAYDDKLFYVPPAVSDDFTAQEFTFTLQKEDDRWKFSDFVLFY